MAFSVQDVMQKTTAIKNKTPIERIQLYFSELRKTIKPMSEEWFEYVYACYDNITDIEQQIKEAERG